MPICVPEQAVSQNVHVLSVKYKKLTHVHYYIYYTKVTNI